MSEQQGKVHLTISDGVAAILIDRPEARNAMTWSMYEQLAAICDADRRRRHVRVATIRGAGGEAFVAGTDIEQFAALQQRRRRRRLRKGHRRATSARSSACRCRPSPSSKAGPSAAAWRSAPPATSASPRRAPRSACRSRARLAIACRWRTRRAWSPRSACRAPSACCCWPRPSAPAKRCPAASSPRSPSRPNSMPPPPRCASGSPAMRR